MTDHAPTTAAAPAPLIESKTAPALPNAALSSRDAETYLHRLAARRFITDLKQTIVFGYTAGFLLAVICFFQYRYTANWSDSLMLAAAYAGLAISGLTLLTPTLLTPIRLFFVKVTGKVGAAIFGTLLTLLYLAALTPLGLYRRARTGTFPFTWWDPSAAAHPAFPPSAWEPKVTPPEIETPTNARPLPLLLQPLRIIRYFHARGQYALIPFIILLVLLGLTMFFIQTSALAPFIYTLF